MLTRITMNIVNYTISNRFDLEYRQYFFEKQNEKDLTKLPRHVREEKEKKNVIRNL